MKSQIMERLLSCKEAFKEANEEIFKYLVEHLADSAEDITTEKFIDSIEDEEQRNKCAYYWALCVGDRDIMRDKITLNGGAYRWMMNIEDKGIVKCRSSEDQKIQKEDTKIKYQVMGKLLSCKEAFKETDEETFRYLLERLIDLDEDITVEELINTIEDEEQRNRCAYHWALFMDRDIMKDKITLSKYAYLWAKNIGDQEIMRNKITQNLWAFFLTFNKITDSESAFWWAVFIGDREIMKGSVTDEKWIQEWNEKFPDDKINLS